MTEELRWQRYRMDATLKNARTTMYAVFNRPPGHAVASVMSPGILVSFRDWPELVSLSSEGRVRWRMRLDAPVKALALQGIDGTAIAATSDGMVYLLAPDGKPLWKYRLEGELTALAASDKEGCAAVGNDRGKLLLLGNDGKPIFDIDMECPAIFLRVSQDGSAVMCADSSGGLSLISRDGKVLWRKLFGDGIADMATTGGCTKTVVLSGKVHSISLDGSERWSAEVPAGVEAVRMSEDGAAIYAVGPEVVVRLSPAGKKLWEGNLKNRPSAASVLPGMKMLVLASPAVMNVVDRWGNFALECPLAAPGGDGECRAQFDGNRRFFLLNEDGLSTHLLIADVGPALVDYLLRAARVFGDECQKIGQPSPFGDRHYLEATSAARSGDYARALENARFSYRYFEETLSSIQHDTESLTNPASLAAIDISVQKELDAPLAKRKLLYQAKCQCGAINDVFTPEVPLLVKCVFCGKLGLVKAAPAGK
jgi:hypothetical protein